MKRKQLTFHVMAFILSILPLVVHLGLNYEYYFTQVDKSYGVGLFLVIIILIYALKDKFAQLFCHNAQMKISLFLLILFWCVSKVYSEVILLAFLSFVGSVLSVPLTILAKKQAGKIKKAHQIDVTREALEGVISINKK
ncbi:MAG: hypothetical protein R3Y32_03620 [Bacillota bacterium]